MNKPTAQKGTATEGRAAGQLHVMFKQGVSFNQEGVSMVSPREGMETLVCVKLGEVAGGKTRNGGAGGRRQEEEVWPSSQQECLGGRLDW